MVDPVTGVTPPGARVAPKGGTRFVRVEPREVSERLWRFGGWLVLITTANAGAALYGAAVIGVLLAAEDSRRAGYPATLEAAAIIVGLPWLASIYTQVLSVRLRSREAVSLALILRTSAHELPTLEGAVIPIVTLTVAWAAGVAVTSGVNAALWAGVAAVVILETIAGWRSRGRRGLVLQTTVGAALGLRLVLH
jgi:hypothetical protein